MSRNDIDIVIGARDRATKVIDGVAGKVGGFGTAAAGMATGVFAGQAALDALKASADAVFAVFEAGVTKLIETSEKINDLSKAAMAIGSSVGDLRSLQLALSELTGADADTVTDALKEMQLRIGEMASGIGSQEQIDILAQLGLDPQTLAAMDPTEQFKAIQAGISEIGSVAERASVADKLLGGDAVRLLPAFTADIETMNAALEAAGATGQDITEEQAAGVEMMRGSFNRIMASLEGVAMQMTGDLAPAIAAIAGQIEAWVPPVVQFVERFGPMIVDALIYATGYATDFAEILGRIAVMDFSGAAEAIEDVGRRGIEWVEATNKKREEVAAAAEARAEQAAKNAESRVGQANAAELARQEAAAAEKAAEKEAARAEAAKQRVDQTISGLERELAVATEGAEAVKRQEQLAAARNETERERIELLHEQLDAIAAQKEAEKEADAARKKAEAEAQKAQEERAAEAMRMGEEIAKFRPGTDATESRTLTRGESQQWGERLVGQNEKQVGILAQIRDLLEPREGGEPNMTLEIVG
jgi:hypothetical protein